MSTHQIREAAALAFHKANPHILDEIVKVCLRVKRLGRKRWSIQAAFEVVRYNAAITSDGRTYKLNNNHSPFYSRWIMRDVPELSGFLVTRSESRVKQEYFE